MSNRIQQKNKILMEGWLRKRGSRMSGTKYWTMRYFVLRGSTLSYYVRKSDVDEKDSIQLVKGCSVQTSVEEKKISSGIAVNSHNSNESSANDRSHQHHNKPDGKSTKYEKLYVIKITWPKGNSATTTAAAAAPSAIESDTPATGNVTRQSSTGGSAVNTPRDIPATFPPPPTSPVVENTSKTTDNHADNLESYELVATGSPSRQQQIRPPFPQIGDKIKTPRKDSNNSILQPLPSRTKVYSEDVFGDSSKRTKSKEENPHRRVQSSTPAFGATDDQAKLNVVETDCLSKSALDGMEDNWGSNYPKKQNKTRKRLVQGTKIAAATGAAVTVGVLTAGVGLAAGLTFVAVGAAAGGSGAVASRSLKRGGERSLTLAANDFEKAQKWKEVLEAVIKGLNGTDDESKASATYNQIMAQLHQGSIESEDDDPPEFHVKISGSVKNNLNYQGRWKPIEGGWATYLGTGAHGLRIYQEILDADDEGMLINNNKRSRLSLRRDASVQGRPCAPLRTRVVLRASPLYAFKKVMTLGRVASEEDLLVMGETRSSFRVVDVIDNHMDIIHVVFRPLYLFPSWTAPRDFCLQRYWRYDGDGSFVVCYDSIMHRECPSIEGYVRGEMHGVYSIMSHKNIDVPESLLTMIVQVDPKGWVPTMKLPPLAHQGYADAFSVSALLNCLDIRDSLDHERFVKTGVTSLHNQRLKQNEEKNMEQLLLMDDVNSLQASSQSLFDPGLDNMGEDEEHYDYNFMHRERTATISNLDEDEQTSLHHNGGKSIKETREQTAVSKSRTIENYPPPLNVSRWAEPDANSFKVRGPNYLKDRQKFNAGDAMMNLIAVDMVEVNSPIITGMCSHPTQRIQKALERERKGGEKLPPFIFCVNLLIPGPPFYHVVIYFGIDDMEKINGRSGTPSSKLAQKFFFGNDDAFRDKTFKLIPQVVEGNFIVRRAVAAKPALVGTKLKQLYVTSDRFFELVVDISSSSVAAGVVRIASGYAKTLVIDLAFLLEGCDEDFLPERVMGCVRLKNPEFEGLRHVEQPDEQ